MSDPSGFKSFLKTDGKSKDEISREIRRMIQQRIEDIAEEAVTEAKQAARPEKIPPRREDYAYPEAHRNTAAKPDRKACDSLAYPPDEPQQAESGDIAEKIRQMRMLGDITYRGYLRKECAELLLVKQGEFLADAEDDYERSAFCAIERPVYGALSTSQLRTYITWRTRARKGDYQPTDKSYVMLYCYELLNKIGVDSVQSAFDKLVEVWNNCRSFASWLDGYMPQWLKDLYAYNRFEQSFSELARSFPVTSAFGLSADTTAMDIIDGNFSNKLEYLMQRSTYNLAGSKFFSSEGFPPYSPKEMLNGTLELELARMNEYFKSEGLSLAELICGRTTKDFSWAPFQGAYVDCDRMDGFMPCIISGAERYCTKRTEPCREVFEYAPYRAFIGYILKSSEAALRLRTGFRNKLTVSSAQMLEELKYRDKLQKAVSSAEFEQIIPAAAAQWCAEHGIYPQPKVKASKKKITTFDDEPDINSPFYTPPAPQNLDIDVSRLAQIREESDEITRKLIVDGDTEVNSAAEITERIEEIEAYTFDESAQQLLTEHTVGLPEEKVHISGVAALFNKPSADFSALSEEWRSFAQSLDEDTLELLAAVLDGTAAQACRLRGILPETLYETINSAALDSIGDIVIEDGAVISDYRDDLKKVVKCI
ncbi:MAG: TerB N-terminal domain-containing protein [Oscillospiraceae bacterium]